MRVSLCITTAVYSNIDDPDRISYCRAVMDIKIKKGDYVTFPKGLSCVWDVKEPVKKHYNFE